jgi:hypothetical protein
MEEEGIPLKKSPVAQSSSAMLVMQPQNYLVHDPNKE